MYEPDKLHTHNGWPFGWTTIQYCGWQTFIIYWWLYTV